MARSVVKASRFSRSKRTTRPLACCCANQSAGIAESPWTTRATATASPRSSTRRTRVDSLIWYAFSMRRRAFCVRCAWVVGSERLELLNDVNTYLIFEPVAECLSSSYAAVTAPSAVSPWSLVMKTGIAALYPAPARGRMKISRADHHHILSLDGFLRRLPTKPPLKSQFGNERAGQDAKRDGGHHPSHVHREPVVP